MPEDLYTGTFFIVAMMAVVVAGSLHGERDKRMPL
jgi:hypothetical protein